MQKEIIPSIDWLQFNTRFDAQKGLDISKNYVCKMLNYKTRHFNKVCEIYKDDVLLMTATYEPHSKILPANTFQFKLDNRRLYEKELFNNINDFLSDCNLSVRGISRIDLCYDFNTWNYEKDCSGFIIDVLSGKVNKKGIRTYDLRGKFTDTIEHEYISFGSNLSDVRCYLYNKTRELNEIKNKPWIRELWQQNNIDTSRDTWRLEFRINSTTKSFLERETGELCSVRNTEDIMDTKRNSIFKFLTHKYFNFTYNRTDTNKTRQEELNLFHNDVSKINIVKNCETLESDRTDKIFIKKLHNEIHKLKIDQINRKESLYKFMIDYCKERELLNWYCSKLTYGELPTLEDITPIM
jgi:hypothetical protein